MVTADQLTPSWCAFAAAAPSTLPPDASGTDCFAMTRSMGTSANTRAMWTRACVRASPLLLIAASISLILYSITLFARSYAPTPAVSCDEAALLIQARTLDENLCRALIVPTPCPRLPPSHPHDAVTPAAGADTAPADECSALVGASLARAAETNSDVDATVLVIFGTRPEAIKLAPVVHLLKRAAESQQWTAQRVRVLSVATGQHASILDTAMSALSLEPDVTMSLMSANQDMASLTARVLAAVGCVLRALKPALVVVQGDTVTAAAGGMAAFLQGVPVAHVEAGLRTFLPRDPYPEEILRTGLSAYATLHFAPTQYAADVLLQSGVCASKLFVVGNTVVDALLSILRAGPSAATRALLNEYGLPSRDSEEVMKEITGEVDPTLSGVRAAQDVRAGTRAPWLIVTMHRRESFGQPVRDMTAAVKELIESVPTLRVLLPVHPNPNVHDVIHATLGGMDRVLLIDPMPYDSFVFTLAAADAVLTDSGGLQEESIALGKRLFVMRQTSERPEALQSGRATLVGTSKRAILHFVGTWAASLTPVAKGWTPPPTPFDDMPVNAASSAMHVGARGEDLYPVSSALDAAAHGAAASHRARPAARLVFGDGLASARIARASLRFLDRFRGALGADTSSVEATRALRDYMSCAHNTFSGASLQPAPVAADHFFHDFVWHKGADALAAGHQRLRQRIECSAQSAPDNAPDRTYAEIAALESYYMPRAADYNPSQFGITVIVSVYRRPQTFLRLLKALGSQSHAPVEVWITTFGSKHEAEFRELIRQHDATASVFKFVSGDPNFKYFGRFALASMAKTPYVALFDDDCIPGEELFSSLLHMINVKNGDYNGLLGMKGHGNVVEQSDHTLASYWVHWVYKGATSTPVDLTGGVWFLRTEWVHATWRETPVPIEPGAWGPWQTGEDFQLTYSLRKHLGLRTYLFPQPLDRPELWGQSADYLDISRAGDTTDISDILTRRQVIFHGLIMKGYTPVRADTVWGEAWNRTNIAVVLSTHAHAQQLRRVVKYLQQHHADVLRVHIILATPPLTPGVKVDGIPATAFADGHADARAAGTERDTRDAILSVLDMQLDTAAFSLGVWDVSLAKLGRHARWRAVDLMIETQSALTGILETLRPAAVIMPALEVASSPILAGASMTAAAMSVPVIGLEGEGMGALCEAIIQPAASAPEAANPKLRGQQQRSAVADVHALCAPLHAYSRSSASMNVVTNSEVLMVQHLFDTLCSCERPSSAFGGAFARCPDLNSRIPITEFRSLSVFGESAT